MGIKLPDVCGRKLPRELKCISFPSVLWMGVSLGGEETLDLCRSVPVEPAEVNCTGVGCQEGHHQCCSVLTLLFVKAKVRRGLG